jgi:hypothetical protein
MAPVRLAGPLAIVLPLVVVLACGGVTVTRVEPGIPKPEGCDLPVFTRDNPIDQPYEVACLLEARTGTSLFVNKDPNSVIPDVKVPACECGADALLVVETQRHPFSLLTPEKGYGQGVAILQGIRFTRTGRYGRNKSSLED